MGQGERLSFEDIKTINLAYCAGDTLLPGKLTQLKSYHLGTFMLAGFALLVL